MYEGCTVAAVLPAYNEARYITAAVRMVPRPLVGDVIVVDDASTDDTAARAREAGADLVITLPANRGVGHALTCGWRAAVARGADIAVVVPGDGQADIARLPHLLERARAGYDLVIADRLSGRDPARDGMPRLRWYGSRVLAWLTWLSTGTYVADPQSGYQAVSRRLVERLRLEEVTERWGTHNDLISHCALAGLRVTTVRVAPVYFAPDGERIASHWRLADVARRNLRVQARALARRVRQRLGRPYYPVRRAGDR